MNKINTTQNASNVTENIMPMPLDFLTDVFKGGYNEQIDKAYMKLLQSDIVKKIKPFVEMALNEEKYEGSPIYNGYLDRDTVSTIVDKVIYYAGEQYPEIIELFENIDTTEYGIPTLLRAIIHELVLNSIYYDIRPENKDNIHYNNDEIITPDEGTMTNMLSSSKASMPSPLSASA